MMGAMRTETTVIPDARGFEDLFFEHRDRLFRTLFLACGSRHDAEELTQEAFLRIWQRWDRVGTSPEVSGYLYRTAINLFISKRRRASVALRTRLFPRASADEEYEAIERRRDILVALRRLPPRQRAVVLLVGFLDYSAEEAARTLSIRPSTVRVLLSRARTTMSEEVSRDA